MVKLCLRKVKCFSCCNLYVASHAKSTINTSEVFVIVSLTLFLPICLEQFARDNGFLLPDKTEPCSALQTPPGNSTSINEDVRCVVKIGWAWIDSASFRCVHIASFTYLVLTSTSLYIYSISVALQAVTVISMGGIADHRMCVVSKYNAIQLTYNN